MWETPYISDKALMMVIYPHMRTSCTSCVHLTYFSLSNLEWYSFMMMVIGDASKPTPASGGAAPVNAKQAKAAKSPSQKKDGASVAPSVTASEKKISDRPPEKDRKKDVPAPRMQFDDEQRVGKAKKRAVVKQTEARNRVELFRHLPQYVHGTLLPDLESKFFKLDTIAKLDLMHPAVYKVFICHFPKFFNDKE